MRISCAAHACIHSRAHPFGPNFRPNHAIGHTQKKKANTTRNTATTAIAEKVAIIITARRRRCRRSAPAPFASLQQQQQRNATRIAYLSGVYSMFTFAPALHTREYIICVNQCASLCICVVCARQKCARACLEYAFYVGIER